MQLPVHPSASVKPVEVTSANVQLNIDTLKRHFTQAELPISLDEYSINALCWKGFTPRSIYRSPTSTSLWPWGGFGFVHLKPVNAEVRSRQHLLQSGFLYCSRLTILDRASGQLIDSHLPVDMEDDGIFAYDWSQMKKYLEQHGFDWQQSVVTLLYGMSIKPCYNIYSGLIVKETLQSTGVKLSQELQAYSSKHVFGLDTESGLQARIIS